ncbi:MAG: type IX secretion system membrane protein PorP/SprF [Cytophagales bacterium]|nr:type IX secretion system membrane protein PorP/SprF [Cytophagales bacterium]
MKLKHTVFSIAIMLGLGLQAQQRPVTSTYMFNGLTLNPAYAGSLNVFSAIFTNRDQWINVEGAPLLQSLTVHNSFLSNRIGVGLAFTRDKLGVHEDNGLYGSYAYKIRTKAGILSMGLQAGFNNRQSNFLDTDVFDPTDPLYANLSTFSPNFGAGLYFANPKMYFGASIPYILTNKVFEIETDVPTESRESRYYYFTGGVVFDMSALVKLSPSFLVRYQENIPFGWDLNATVIFENIAYVGVSYRSGDAIVFITQFIVNENFRVGYAYDAITSPLTQYTKGSHEIMINYRIKLKNHKKDPQCPVYF